MRAQASVDKENDLVTRHVPCAAPTLSLLNFGFVEFEVARENVDVVAFREPIGNRLGRDSCPDEDARKPDFRWPSLGSR